MKGFITHCGAAEVTREEAFAVPVPEYTATHRPVSYEELTRFIEGQLVAAGLSSWTAAYALNRKGQHFFAKYVIDVDGDNSGMGLSAVFRQSYNMQFKPAAAFGGHTFCCDNLALTGDYFVVMHKNTKNGWERFQERYVLEAWRSSPLQAFYQAKEQANNWAEITLSEREGYRVLGELAGNRILTANQASVAFGDWRKPRYEDFEERNFQNLSQCVTEGLKKGPVASMPERHIRANKYMASMEVRG